MTAPTSMIQNAMSVDVEDYFQVSAFDDVVARDEWDARPSRVAGSTRTLLDLFARHDVRGTFFVLGWVADRHPDLLVAIHDAGHEIASHGYEHRLVTSMDAEAFRADLRRAADAIHAACGVTVEGFRAPSFSFSHTTPWAHEVLRQEGYAFSSSVFPVRHDRYGMPAFPRHPVPLKDDAGRVVWEFPMTTWRVLGRNLPAAGGGWLRALPLFVTRRAIRAANANGWPANVYVHPWEVDPDQPIVAGASRRDHVRHRLNLRRTHDRLDRLLEAFRFGTVTEALRGYRARLASVPTVAANPS